MNPSTTSRTSKANERREHIQKFKRTYASILKGFASFRSLCAKLDPDGRLQALSECLKNDFYEENAIDGSDDVIIPMEAFMRQIAGKNSEQRWDSGTLMLNGVTSKYIELFNFLYSLNGICPFFYRLVYKDSRFKMV